MFTPKPVSDTGSSFYMAGTEGSGKYIVPVVTDAGKVGFRVLSDDSIRVRVEPSSTTPNVQLAELLSAEHGWKQPNVHNPRYSHVFDDGDEAIKAIETIIAALGTSGKRHNRKSAWTWRSALRGLKRKQLISSGYIDDDDYLDNGDGYQYP